MLSGILITPVACRKLQVARERGKRAARDAGILNNLYDQGSRLCLIDNSATKLHAGKHLSHERAFSVVLGLTMLPIGAN